MDGLPKAPKPMRLTLRREPSRRSLCRGTRTGRFASMSAFSKPQRTSRSSTLKGSPRKKMSVPWPSSTLLTNMSPGMNKLSHNRKKSALFISWTWNNESSALYLSSATLRRRSSSSIAAHACSNSRGILTLNASASSRTNSKVSRMRSRRALNSSCNAAALCWKASKVTRGTLLGTLMPFASLVTPLPMCSKQGQSSWIKVLASVRRSLKKTSRMKCLTSLPSSSFMSFNLSKASMSKPSASPVMLPALRWLPVARTRPKKAGRASECWNASKTSRKSSIIALHAETRSR
mmetsp:Transcript_49628/g.138904  ORF Transcript_49628/g.138904 Transcript_49628/m.138904 type:complete len:290 (+) Transcript_49628:3014-3883(+)